MNGKSRSSTDQAYSEVVNALGSSVDAIVQRVAARVRGEVPVYDQLDDNALGESIRINTAVAAQVLRSGAHAMDVQLCHDLDCLVRDRMAAGFGSNDMVQGHNVIMGEIHALFAQLSEQWSLPSARTVEATQTLWQASNLVLQRATAVMHDEALQRAVRDIQVRTRFVRELAAGQLRGVALERQASAYGIDHRNTFFAVRARPAHDCNIDRLVRSLLDRSSDLHRRGLIVAVDGECIGVLPSKPEGDFDARVAVGTPQVLNDISLSFAAAEKVAIWMDRRGEQGIRDLQKLSWRLLADEDTAVAQLLTSKYLHPLDMHLSLKPLIIDALAAYLDHDRNVNRAAEALVIHPNTLRYRLRKYTEIAHIELEETDHLVALAIALEAHRAVVAGYNGDA